jgi:sulfhydrogenase subunit alpha
MSKKSINVNVEYLTRVEGHGNIVVDVKDGSLDTCELQIVEAPRFFEGMLRGRSIFEAQHITSRICGICACGHSLASIQAAEAAIGFTPTWQTTELRKFLLHMENLDSHLLHIYLLVAPDLLGVKSFVPLIASHNKVVRRALRMKKVCNDICTIQVGRHITRFLRSLVVLPRFLPRRNWTRCSNSFMVYDRTWTQQ